jgi:O-antigen ligase
MQNMPDRLAYQNGAITLSVLRHVTVPRALWKDKPALPSDTEVMSKYTGLAMVWNDDTSISIGYLGELYADFGYTGGIVGSLIIGLLVGTAYRLVRDQKRMSALMAAGLCLMLALPIAYFGTAYVKLIGSFVLTFFLVLTLSYSVFPVLFPAQALVESARDQGKTITRKFHRI